MKASLEHETDSLVTRRKAAPSRAGTALSRILLFFEDLIKVPVFGCQHCGECLLSHTALICCQRCPKRMRNGPCGGTRANGHCEVYPERRCVWVRIHRRAARWGRLPLLNRLEKIHDWEMEKTSAWLNVARGDIEPPAWIVRKEKRHDPERKT